MSGVEQLDFHGMAWYSLTRLFPSPEEAREAFELLDVPAKKAKGKLELGVYRHGPPQYGAIFVTVVSHKPKGMAVAERVLGGKDVTLAHEVVRSLIARRVRVMAEIAETGAESGSRVVRRGKRGAFLHPDGTLDERIGEG